MALLVLLFYYLIAWGWGILVFGAFICFGRAWDERFRGSGARRTVADWPQDSTDEASGPAGNVPRLASTVWLQFGFGLVLLVLALVWQQATLPFNFGERTPVVRSADGRGEFYLQRKGGVHYSIVAKWNGREVKHQLPGFKRPDRVFWMLDGTAIGIDYGDYQPPMIFYVEHWFKVNDVYPDKQLTQEELDKARLWRKLSPEEQRLFEQAKQAAEKSP
ncbi:MAG: hypothetical protein ACOY3P_09665 [Planctomycetota bacterium]